MKRDRRDATLVSSLLQWFEQSARDLPWRRTRDPYAIWVSEIMLQQTQVKTVIPYWKRWLSQLPDIAALAAAKPEQIHKLWEGLGYYTRVRNLQKAAQQIVKDLGGAFPRSHEDVLALPGIGRYTAGAICSIAFNEPQPILDGNVIRVLTRLEGIDGDPRSREVNAQLWTWAAELVQTAARTKYKNACSHLNQSLMELGALICAPKQPRCEICPVSKHCVALRDGRIHELPALPQRASSTQRRFAAFIAERGGKFLARQRPAGVVNGHLWEFPNAELVEGELDLKATATGILGETTSALSPFYTVRHSITRYRITLEAYRVGQEHSLKANTPQGTWLTLQELDRLPFTSAHRKILERLLSNPVGVNLSAGNAARRHPITSRSRTSMKKNISRRSALRTITGGTAAIAAAASLSHRLRAADATLDAKTKGHINHSVCKWCYPKIELDEFCTASKGMGLQSVELLSVSDFPTLKKHDLVCAMVSGIPGGIVSGLNRTKNHDKIVEFFEQTIPIVAEHGYPNIICFSGNRAGMSDEEGLENCAVGLKRIAPTAEKYKVTVCMELLNSKRNHKDYMCDHTAWGVALAKKVGSERFKLLYDIFHMQIMEGDICDTIKENYQYIGHYHTGGVPGRAEIDETQEINYPLVMKAIADTGYKGFVAQEFVPKRSDPLASLKQGVQICDI